MRKLLLAQLGAASAPLVLGLLFLGACKPAEYVPPLPVREANDKVEMCPAACGRARLMSCDEARPLIYESRPCQVNAECPEGSCMRGLCTETCEDVCKALIEKGRHVGTECWARINYCSEIETKCRKG